MKIEIDGIKYKITESLGYQQCGCKAKFVETLDGEKVAVFEGGKWRWWTSNDRLGRSDGAEPGEEA